MDAEARQRLSDLIKRARGHMSQRQFAKQLGVSFAAIRSWEECESMPGTKNLEAIADLTGQTLEELLEYLKGDSLLPRSDASKAEDLLVPLNALSREELARLIEMAAARLVRMSRESEEAK